MIFFKRTLIILIIFLCSVHLAFALVAFPGAEGFGAATRGAYTTTSNPTIYQVTTTADNSNPGSFRYAVTRSGPRVVIFKVGGIITLGSTLRIDNPYITILGQTAPGNGICIKNNPVKLGSHDMIIRGLRFRNGHNRNGSNDRQGNCLAAEVLYGSVGNTSRQSYNIIIDHNSFSWGGDELTSSWFPANHITWQWNIVAESLWSQNYPSVTGYGIIAGDDATSISMHHNLMAHNRARNPEVNDGTSGEIINNLVYHYTNKGIDFIGAPNEFSPFLVSNWNCVKNYLKRNESGKKPIIIFIGTGYQNNMYVKAGSKYFMQGNFDADKPTLTGDWDSVQFYDDGNTNTSENYKSATPVITPSGIRENTVEDTYNLVLNNAGAQAPVPDSVDARIIDEVKNNTGTIKQTISDSEYPPYPTGSYPQDSDSDGLPDAFEQQYGGNTTGLTQNGLAPSGYSWIEEYANSCFPKTIFASANPESITSDGVSSTIIKAELKDICNWPLTINVPVTYTITGPGTFGGSKTYNANAVNGVANATFTSTESGISTVTITSPNIKSYNVYIPVSGNTPPDTTSPAAINNLSVTTISSSTIRLQWTSVGDDGTTGTATSYDIRYRTGTPITSSNWGSATPCTGEPTPQASGNNETFTVSSLTPDTTYYFAMMAGDEVINWSGISNVVSGKTAVVGDITSPGAINTLITNTPTLNSITLNWTSVGDDGTTGTATSYDIRYRAGTPITSSNWGSATQCSGEPTPRASGNSETYTATGLTPDTTYYFAVKVLDEVPNTSVVSNVVSGKTAVTPPTDTTAPSMINTLAVGNPTTASVTLTWTAVGDDGTTGTATSYDIRYRAGTPITTSNWGSATPCTGEPVPQASGNAETYTANGLTEDTTYYFAMMVGDEVINWSVISNVVSGKTAVTPPQDTTPPGTVNTLMAGNPTTTSVTLNWTSVGDDDGTIGTATSYDIRYLINTPVTSSNWNSAAQCTGEPTPQLLGNVETFTVTNLLSNTTYYFAMKVGDEVPNWSGVSNSPSGKTSVVVVGELAGEWHFEEGIGTTTADTSGNNNRGTLINSPVWTTGKVGSGLQFDGQNTYVSVNDSNSLDVTTAISIEAWVKTAVITTDGGTVVRRVVDKGVYALGASNQAFFRINSGFISKLWSSSDVNIWHHLVGTYDSAGGIGNMKLYQDGVLVASSTYTGTINTNTSILNIGRQSSTVGRFNGVIDEVRLYNRAISASEVLQHYESSNPQQDTTAPSNIGNLATSNMTQTAITLTWTAVGDDGTTGTATGYDIRYIAGTPITGSNFASATQVTGEPTPKVAGGSETLTVSNLTANTTYYFAMKVADEVPNASGLSNVVSGKTASIPPVQDTTVPAQVNTLATGNPTTTTITLTWTSVGDDGTTGTATSYDIRYRAGTPITSSNFTSATQVAGVPTPQAAGNGETVTVSNLNSDTTYYFAIKVLDEVPNTSVLSNVVIGKTNAIPDTTSPNAVNTLAASNLTQTTITLSWTSVGDNGATGTATSYDIRYMAGTPITGSNFASAIQVTGEPTPKASGNNETLTVNSLTANTTYYFAMKVLDEVPNTSGISNVVSGKTASIPPQADVTVPSTINTLTTNNPSYTSITLNWTSVGDDGTTGTATIYDIRYMEGTPITAGNFGNATQISVAVQPQTAGSNESVTVYSLTSNTTYYFGIKVGDEVPNWSGISNIAVTKTLGAASDLTAPNDIAGLSQVSASSTTITINWIAPGDDGTDGTATSYDIRYIAGSAITDTNWGSATQCSGEPTPQASGNGETYTLTNLQPNTTYYVAIKATDESSNWTNLSNVISIKTSIAQGSEIPNSISYLASTPLNNGSIQINWLESTSENIASYRIYMSTGETMDYTTPSYVVASTQTQLTINNLTANQEYNFVVRAVDTNNNEDPNTNIISETAVMDVSDTTQSKLTTPTNGLKLSGTNVLLMADNLVGDISNILSVTFEYRKVGDIDWTKIPVSNTSGLPTGQAGITNPDITNPYYIQWDVSNLDENAQYNVRAIVTDKNGLTEIKAGYITVSINDLDPDIYETIHGSIHNKSERIDNRRLNIVKILDSYSSLICSVKISTGVLTNGTTDRLLIKVNPQTAPKVSSNLVLIGNIHEIKLESGQTQFAQDIEITLPYKDTDNNNRVDDKDISNSKLIVCTYNSTTKKWEKVATTTINKINRQLITKTKHLSYYGIFAVLQTDLSTAHVYPNPFKPSLGQIKIFFANLTTHTKLKIFNVSGELVYEDDKDTPAGELSWDVKNSKGEPIASGVYIYMITNNNGQTKKGKLAIIR